MWVRLSDSCSGDKKNHSWISTSIPLLEDKSGSCAAGDFGTSDGE